MKNSFTEQLNSLESSCIDSILTKISETGSAEINPNSSVKSVDVSNYDVLVDGFLIEFINVNGLLFDENNLIYNIQCLSLSDLCNLADNI